jgi:hypothetical protein
MDATKDSFARPICVKVGLDGELKRHWGQSQRELKHRATRTEAEKVRPEKPPQTKPRKSDRPKGVICITLSGSLCILIAFAFRFDTISAAASVS